LGETVLWKSNLDSDTRAAAALGPEIDLALRWCEKNHPPLRFVSVADGPGSFTGLRIAVTTAKTLSYALAIPLVAVDSLAAIAASVFYRQRSIDSLIVALNAYRGQVFHGAFDRSELLVDIAELPVTRSSTEKWTAHPDSVAIAEGEAWQRILHRRRPDQSVAGDALPLGGISNERRERSCDAVGVGLLGLRSAICSDWVDPISLVPRYLKPSAAEEKLKQR
jgi:tRNA threonylcarbamoyladenosine biosynthesis protein TsaB